MCESSSLPLPVPAPISRHITNITIITIMIIMMVVIIFSLPCRALNHLMMSHNNVGRRGARAVFMALRHRARDGVELLVDLQSCELGSDMGDDLFDMYSPSGR